MPSAFAAVRPVGWGERGAVTALFLANGIATGAWAVLPPVFKDRLGLDDWALSNALLAFALGCVVAMPTAAVLSPRLGAGRASVLSGVLTAVMLALVPWVPGLAVLCVVAALFGGLLSMQSVAMNAYGSRLESAWGGPIMSSLHGAYSAGALVGSLAGGVLVGVDPAIAAWIPAAIVVLINLGTLATLQPGERSRSTAAVFAPPERGMIGLCVLILFGVLVESSVLNWSSVYLVGVVGVSVGTAAGGYMAYSLGMATSRLVGDVVVRALGGVRVVLIGGTLATIGLAMVAFAPVFGVAVAGFALVGIGLGNIAPTAFGAASRLTAQPASGVAMVSTAAYVSYIIGPPLIGGVATLTDLRAGMAVLVGSAVMVVLSARAMRAARPV